MPAGVQLLLLGANGLVGGELGLVFEADPVDCAIHHWNADDLCTLV